MAKVPDQEALVVPTRALQELQVMQQFRYTWMIYGCVQDTEVDNKSCTTGSVQTCVGGPANIVCSFSCKSEESGTL